jgi:hypothetical protein
MYAWAGLVKIPMTQSTVSEITSFELVFIKASTQIFLTRYCNIANYLLILKLPRLEEF